MLAYGDDKKRAAFRAVIERARQDGLSPAELASMITAVEIETPGTNGVHTKESCDVISKVGERWARARSAMG